MRPSPFHKGSGKPAAALGASNLGKKPVAGKAKAVDSEVSLGPWRRGSGKLGLGGKQLRLCLGSYIGGWLRESR